MTWELVIVVMLACQNILPTKTIGNTTSRPNFNQCVEIGIDCVENVPPARRTFKTPSECVQKWKPVK